MNAITYNGRTRYDLAMFFYGKGVEVGVADGDYSNLIMEDNQNVTKLYGVDPYIKHEGYGDYKRKSTFDAMQEHAHAKLDKYVPERYEFIHKYSVDAAKDFEDKSLDFVYIDADHGYDAVITDLNAWLPKVKDSAFMAGDDYVLGEEKNRYRYDVIRAVNDFVEKHGLYLNVYNGMRQVQWMFQV